MYQSILPQVNIFQQNIEPLSLPDFSELRARLRACCPTKLVRECSRGSDTTTLELHPARPKEAREVMKLYEIIYEGTYPYHEVFDHKWLIQQMNHPDNVFFTIVDHSTGKVVGTTLFQMNLYHQRAYGRGGLIHPDYMGYGLGSALLGKAYEKIIFHSRDFIKIYFTEGRTAHVKIQKISENNGCKPIGFFINKDLYYNERETDILLAMMSADILRSRRQNPQIHPTFKSMYEVIRRFFRLETAKYMDIPVSSKMDTYNDMFEARKDSSGYIHVNFKIMPRSFLQFKINTNTKVAEDAYFQVQDPSEFRYLLNEAISFFRKANVQYFEMYMPVTQPEYQAIAAQLGFIATGYFPGWQRVGNERIDHLILTWLAPNYDIDTSKAVLTRYGSRIRDAVLQQIKMSD
ncbi:MAG: GNAT family N-acetyltransferase [Candidatus Helarchaeota archaeon]